MKDNKKISPWALVAGLIVAPLIGEMLGHLFNGDPENSVVVKGITLFLNTVAIFNEDLPNSAQ